MKTRNTTRILTVLALAALWGPPREGAAQTTASNNTNPPAIISIAKPVAGDTTIWFRGGTGPFTVQMRSTLDASSPWFDLPGAKVVLLQPGVFMALIPNSQSNLEFYRVVSQAETITDLKGWTVLAQVSAPANKQNFVAGEKPIEILRIDETVAHRQAERLRKLRAGRSSAEVARRLDALRTAAEGKENLMPYIYEAVKAYATLGEICDAMRLVFGTYEEVAIT